MVSLDSFEVYIDNEKFLFTAYDVQNRDIVFKFTEKAKVTIENKSTEFNIVLETDEEDENGLHEVIIKHGKNYELNNKQSSKCAMPYRLKLVSVNNNYSITSYYLVEPLRSLGNNGFINMINYINQYNQNIYFNDLQTKIIFGKRTNDNFYSSSLFIAKQLSENSKKISGYLNTSLDEISTLKDVIVKSKLTKKVNEKTIVKSLINFNNNEKNYSIWKKVHVNYDDYTLLFSMLRICKKNLSSLLKWLKESKELIDHDYEINKIQFNIKTSVWLKEYLEKNKSKSELLGDYYVDISSLYKNVNNILVKFPVEFRNKRDAFITTKKFLMKPNFNYLYNNLYVPFLTLKISFWKSYKEILGYPLFETSKIFEILILFKIIEAITDIGFISNENLLSDLTSKDVQNEYDFVFFKGDFKLELKYNYIINKLNNESQNNEIISINAYHNKPDYTITLYKNNYPIYLLIVDAKCRNFDKILDYIGPDRKANGTVLDYISFRVFEDNYIKSKQVDDLMFVCPLTDTPLYEDDNKYGCLFINTSLKTKYDNFHKILMNTIGDYIETY